MLNDFNFFSNGFGLNKFISVFFITTRCKFIGLEQTHVAHLVPLLTALLTAFLPTLTIETDDFENGKVLCSCKVGSLRM